MAELSYEGYELTSAIAELAGDPITATTATDTFTAAGHGLTVGQVVALTVITGLSGVSLATRYFVVNATTNTFKIAATAGGSAISVGTGTGIVVLPMVEVRLSKANKFAPQQEEKTYTWESDSEVGKLTALVGVTYNLDHDCVPVSAQKAIFKKGTITGSLPGGLIASTAVAFGGGTEKQGAAIGVRTSGYARKYVDGSLVGTVKATLWLPTCTITTRARPGLTSGSTWDKVGYSIAASKTKADILGATIAGFASDGEFGLFAEAN